MTDYYHRYERYYGVQSCSKESVMGGWVFRYLGLDQDEALRQFNRYIMDHGVDNYRWRVVKCGPPQYDYLVQEVLRYRE